jgi:hypothetical protein
MSRSLYSSQSRQSRKAELFIQGASYHYHKGRDVSMLSCRLWDFVLGCSDPVPP